MRKESVLCPACGEEWTIGLVELVRRRGEPLRCPSCTRAHARDAERLSEPDEVGKEVSDGPEKHP